MAESAKDKLAVAAKNAPKKLTLNQRLQQAQKNITILEDRLSAKQISSSILEDRLSDQMIGQASLTQRCNDAVLEAKKYKNENIELGIETNKLKKTCNYLENMREQYIEAAENYQSACKTYKRQWATADALHRDMTAKYEAAVKYGRKQLIISLSLATAYLALSAFSYLMKADENVHPPVPDGWSQSTVLTTPEW